MGYILRLTLDEAAALRQRIRRHTSSAMDSMTSHVQAMLDWQQQGAVVFDYGNNLRQAS
ncbi:MAG: hypothetical protein R2854_29405 [Caldilineaceae bacterium]